jgi:hypothetical protein
LAVEFWRFVSSISPGGSHVVSSASQAVFWTPSLAFCA